MLSIRNLALLVRPVVSLFVALTALATDVFFRHGATLSTGFLFLGTFLLSCAASSLNQYQERDADSRMDRTKTRPLPSGQLTPLQTGIISILTALAGFAALFFGATPVAALVGAIALALYNGIYTPLKKSTPLALFPGALAGAFPVLIGCAAAQGTIEPLAVYIALFSFFWQVPHFMQLSLRFEKDFRAAGISTLLSRISPERLRIVTAIWLLAACAVATLFPVVGIFRGVPQVSALIALNMGMVAIIMRSLRWKHVSIPQRTLYLYQGIVFGLLPLQGVLVTP
jgi:heme o synthase